MKKLFQFIKVSKIIIFAVLLGLPLIRPVFSATSCCELGIAGSEMLYFNRSMESFALGGVSGGLEMKPGNFVVNPSTASTLLQQMVMANFGHATENIHYLNAGYLYPTDYGVFGGYYAHFFDLNTQDYFFSIGPVFSKEINKKIALGAMLFFDYYRIENPSIAERDVMPFGVNFSLSALFRADWNYKASIFAFKDFVSSVQVDQAGLIPWREELDQRKIYLKTSDLFKIGAGFTFMEANLPNNGGKWQSRFLGDVGLTFPIDFTYNLGWKNSFIFNGRFKELTIMLGHYRVPIVRDPFPLSGGLGTAFMVSDAVKMELNYAFGLKKRDSMEGYHSLGFNIYFGEVDSDKPEISSPFGDEGVIDSENIE